MSFKPLLSSDVFTLFLSISSSIFNNSLSGLTGCSIILMSDNVCFSSVIAGVFVCSSISAIGSVRAVASIISVFFCFSKKI